MIKAFAFLTACAVTLASPQVASAAQACLIEESACASIQEKKNAKMVNVLRKKPSQYVGVDQATVGVIYSTFENLQNKANKGCKRNDKVDVSGYKPFFVLGQGRQKRALLIDGQNKCTWLKVK